MAKVHELAKELGITSKVLLEKAAELGIEVKSHMSALSAKDEERLRAEFGSGKKKTPEPTPGIAAIPGAPPFAAVVGAPPFAANVVGVSKAVVDEEYFEQKKKKKEEEAKAKKEAEAPKEEPKEEIKEAETTEVSKEETKAETPEISKEETKAKASKAEKPVEEPKEEEAPAEEPKEEEKTEPVRPSIDSNRQVLKIVKTAEELRAEEEAAKAESLARQKAQEKKKQVKSTDARPEKEGRSGRQDKQDRQDRRERGDRGDRGERGEGRPSQKFDRKQGQQGKFDRNRNERQMVEEEPLPKAADRRRRGDSGSKDGSQGKDYGKKSGKKSYEDKHDKFDKFERKSLEKQSKGKHAKYKTNEPVVEIEEEVLPEGTVVLTVPITVAGFCEQTEVSTSKVIMTLMKLGIMANINQNIDEETVMVLADELGITVHVGKVEETVEEEGLELFEDKDSDLEPRPPIITVMGHVDHGKTSLLDAIRKTNVTASESGGITQHIGASEVSINGQRIVFLDTPGHEAFTAMRARGAHVTDIAVLVVAADDGVMPQTIESISHAKAAGVPIIVAINKMDKPGANPDRVKQELADHGVLVEDWGGDVISVPVSAKSGDGIVNLLEMILLQAEVLELKANPNRLAMGSVIEARLDKAKGPVATLLVTNGTLESGQSIVAGTCAGRIRLMTDDKGRTIRKAGPATAVEILGLTEVPQAGDEFNAVKEDKIAREIAERRSEKLREEVLARNASMSLEKLFSQIQEGEVKELNLILKGDVQGSIGALVSSLEKLNNDEVKVNIIHTGVGTVTESDIMLAGTSGAIIIGFNVRPSTAVQTMADRENIEIRTYTVIYDAINDVEKAMNGMLDPKFKEEILGKVEIRNTFKVPNVGIIGGAYVTEGKVLRNAQVRLVRDGIVIHEGSISSLKRFKDDAKEVAQGYECGIGIENYNDIKEGDVIECFHMVEIQRN